MNHIRHLLEKNKISKQIFDDVTARLEKAGLIMHGGTNVIRARNFLPMCPENLVNTGLKPKSEAFPMNMSAFAQVFRGKEIYAAAINRANPDFEEMKFLFEGHISNGTLVLCDGLRSYNVLPSIAECTVKDCNGCTADESHFYNLKYNKWFSQLY